MTPTRDRLYALLPAIYRIRDDAEGEPLRALLAVVEQELDILEGNVADLYEDWFIETCAEWVVPYIGDLLDVGELYSGRPESGRRSGRTAAYGQQERRAYVANTLAYRRRKGTAPILEQLTRDVTGWRSRVVEFAQLVNTTQHLDHLRPSSATVSLRDSPQQVGTPFETQAACSVEIRPTPPGRYNPANMGLYVYRLQSYPLGRVSAYPIPTPTDPSCLETFVGTVPLESRCYRFNPLGIDAALFNQPQTETNIVTLAGEINLPVPLRITSLAAELAERRQAQAQGDPPAELGYFDSDPVLQLFVNRQPRPIPPEEILIRSLEPWPAVADLSAAIAGSPIPLPTVAVDPTLGRIAFLGKTVPEHLEASYFYGFSDDLGGGPYNRPDAPDIQPPFAEVDQTQIQIAPLEWIVQQASTADPNPLASALQAWNQTVTAWDGFDRGTHIPLARLTVPAVHLVQIDQERVRRRFEPGIVGDGLMVSPGLLCPTEVGVAAGVAVDAQGRSLRVPQWRRFDLRQVDLDCLPCRAGCFIGVLVLAHDPNALEGARLAVLPAATVEGYPDATVIPLARLQLTGQYHLAGPIDLQVRPEFAPGIVQGLAVETRPGTLDTIVTAGTGVDARGRVVVLSQNYAVDVRPHQGQVRSLVLRIPSRSSRWQLDILAPAALPPDPWDDPDQPVVHLADLDIPQVRVSDISPEVRPTAFVTFNGLDVTPRGNQVTVSLGTITVDGASSPLLELEQRQQLDLSAYAGRTLILFMAIAPESGLPLDPVGSPAGKGWRNLGLVPERPLNANAGCIIIGDNATYMGDLTVVLPAQQRLIVVAANGYRPHIQGSLTVRGMAIAAERDRRQGELTLDGLLVQGQLWVRAGNLGQLTLRHCTLVPYGQEGRQGGLSVEAAQLQASAATLSDDASVPLLAFAFYSLNQIWLLIQQELGIRHVSSPAMADVMARMIERIIALVAELLQQLQVWLGGETSATGEDLFPAGGNPLRTTAQDNSRLVITIERSITGAIALPETVPQLRIVDSLVDKGFPREPDTSGVAIAALGTTADILSTTVFGRTTLRQLEASNSLFTEKVTVLRRQEGCLRFCYAPVGSVTPSRYQCQPDRALGAVLDQVPNGVSALFLSDEDTAAPAFSDLLIGTAGDGIFHVTALEQAADQTLLNAPRQTTDEGTPDNDAETSAPEPVEGWVSANVNLSDRHITALLAYRSPEMEGGTAPRLTLLLGTLSGRVFEARPERETILNSRGEGQKRWHIPHWAPLPLAGGNAPITALLAIENAEGATDLWAATAGSGVWRADGAGQNWQPVTAGLTHFNVSTLLWDEAQNQLWAGTRGGGVFLLQTQEDGDRWEAQNEGLDQEGDRQITALTQDISPNGTRSLLIGTATNGVFAYSDIQRWIPHNAGLTSLEITALVSFPVTSTISAANETVTGTLTYFTKRGLVPGDEITIGDQVREIESICSDSVLTITEPVDDPLTALSFSEDTVWLVGTADGKLLCAIGDLLQAEDADWSPLGLDLKGTDATTLVVSSKPDTDAPLLFAGTAAGEVLRSEDGGQQWQSLLAGRLPLARKLQVLNRLQPDFTSTCYGDPGYGQLRQSCAPELYTGAEDGAEMGVFHSLKQPQREANLKASLEEYLRFGLSAGIFYVT
ncbi:MAG: hypothetical protein WBA10_05615 [Elainellaceae cyanobacterium]